MWGITSYRVIALITVVVFTLLVNLGFWQLGRGEEKLLMEKQLQGRKNLPYLSIERIPENRADITGLKVKARLADTEMPLLYLDNQTLSGTVGYLVYQPMQISGGNLSGPTRYLLAELGFVAAGTSREELPDVAVRLPAGLIEGRIYSRSANPLSSDLMAEVVKEPSSETQGSVRIQNLNFSQLNTLLDVPFAPFAIQPDKLENWPLPQPWQPLPMPSSKHFGYALQWFVMAMVWAMIMLKVAISGYQKIKKEML